MYSKSDWFSVCFVEKLKFSWKMKWLYPSDTVIKCTLCTGLNIVLWDRVNINCTKILKADTKQPWKVFIITFMQFWYLIKWTTNSTGIRANWINCLLYKVVLNLHIFPVLNKNCTNPYLAHLLGYIHLYW